MGPKLMATGFGPGPQGDRIIAERNFGYPEQIETTNLDPYRFRATLQSLLIWFLLWLICC